MPKSYDPAYYQRTKEAHKERVARWSLAHPRAKQASNRKRYLAHKAKVDALKLEEGCIDCGYRDNVDALEFDHVRGRKHAQVAGLYMSNIDVLSAEILKCEVRCANCHSIATAERRKVG